MPTDATVGSAYYVGVSAEIEGLVSTGVWKIIVVSSRNAPFETAEDFEAALVAGTSTFKYDSMDLFSDSPAEAAKFPVERLELASGKALAIQIDIRGVTATVADPYKAVDQFGGLLNGDGRVLLASGIVAARSPAVFDAPTSPDDDVIVTGDADNGETDTEADQTPTTPADGADQPDEGDQEEGDTTDVADQPPADPVADDGATTAGSSQLKAAEGDDPAAAEETTPDDTEEEETVTWSPLSADATRYIYPSFAWVVPDSAAAGEALYVLVNVAKGSSDLQHDNYFGVFEVTVIAPPEPAAEEETKEMDEGRTLVATVLIVTAVAAATAAIFYFFLV